MNKYKHSGALGDLIYSLAVVKHFGGGEFYLHLDQLDWIGQHYYGSAPNPFHQGRMTQKDFEYMQSFILAQEGISRFECLTAQTEITHNLDRFRPPFVGHPGNYLDIYADVFGIARSELNRTPWLTVPMPLHLEGRNIAINRTSRWIPPSMGPEWNQLRAQGVAEQAFFLGLETEYQKFIEDTGWDIPWVETRDMLTLAQFIAGAEIFIGNQSQCYALAVGLGVEEIWLELRRDLPKERNECYFPTRPEIRYI